MKTSTRLFLLLALVLAQASAFATTYTVEVTNNAYSPDNLSIKPGDVVIWQWKAGNHPTAFDKNEFATFQMNSSSQTKSITFTTAGTYNYHCQAHAFFDTGSNSWQGMVGTISVNVATPTIEARLATPALNVYPNPSKGMVMVSLGQKSGEAYKLRFSNIIGREVRTITLKPEVMTEALPVNLSDLPAGVYFYSLLVNDKVVSTKRLVLQN